MRISIDIDIIIIRNFFDTCFVCFGFIVVVGWGCEICVGCGDSCFVVSDGAGVC